MPRALPTGVCEDDGSRADGQRDMSKPQRVYMRPHEGEDWGSDSFLQRFVDALEAAAAAQGEPTDDQRHLAMCVDIATRAHERQLDKAGRPYIGHPLRVMSRVEGLHTQMAAVLHDVLEDTTVTSEELRDRGVPDPVIDAVETLTRRTGESYESFVRRIVESGDPIALQVKHADIADNTDPDRLAELPEDTRARLTKKYRAALRILGSSTRRTT